MKVLTDSRKPADRLVRKPAEKVGREEIEKRARRLDEFKRSLRLRGCDSLPLHQ